VNSDEVILEERFAAWVAACDEALATGQELPEIPAAATNESFRERLERHLACMQLLREAFPAPAGANRVATDGQTIADDPFAHGVATADSRQNPAPAGAISSDSIPGRLGRFEIRGRLGKGAFGVVFKAYDPRLCREVALKVPRAEVLIDADFRKRFVREARAAAGLQHPHIVTVYEAGEIGPVCYIASAYCDGCSLAEWLKQQTQPVDAAAAAELVATLADAMEHAHSRGVIHRDLKPANVLLRARDGECGVAKAESAGAPGSSFRAQRPSMPAPMITDFGLARFSAETDIVQTQSGAILGTPGYMAPEQALGRTREVGALADVYGLGAILYELLTGRPPFRGESVLDTLEQIRTREPVPPRRLRPGLPRDLETVCLKCLEKEPRKRYGSARALAEELRRFQAGEPVHARPAGPIRRSAKWIRRRPAVAILLASLITVTVGGFVGVIWKWRDAESALAGLRRNLYFNNVSLAERALDANNLLRAERLLEECPPELRRWEWHYLRRKCYVDEQVLRGHEGAILCMAVSPRGEILGSGGRDCSIRLWQTASGRQVRVLEGPGSPIHSLAFSPDGRLLAAGDAECAVRVWDVATGNELWNATGASVALAFSPDGSLLAGAGEREGAVHIWDASSGQPLRNLIGHKTVVHGLAFHPDNRRLVTASWDKTLRIWDAGTGEHLQTLEGHTRAVFAVRYTPDGNRLVSASGDEADCGRGEIFVWDCKTGVPTLELRGHTAKVTCIAITPDGSRVASASRDMTVKLWDLETGREVLSLHGFTNFAESVAFCADSRRMVVGGWDQLVHIYDAAPYVTREIPKPSLTRSGWGSVTFSPDGRRLAAGGPDYSVREWDCATGELVHDMTGHTWYVTGIAYNRDGSRLASCGWDRTPRLWDAESGREMLKLPELGVWTSNITFDSHGRQLATVCGDGNIQIWDASTGRLVQTLVGDRPQFIYSVAISPDDTLIAQACDDGTVAMWELPSGRRSRTLHAHRDRVTCVAFTPDGKYFATMSSLDGTAKLWTTADAALVRTFRGVSGMSMAFSPDGRRLAAPVADDRVRVWDIMTGNVGLTLLGSTGEIRSVAYSPDGQRIACFSYALAVNVWDLPSADERHAGTADE
jgi:eukaryotic-like serine/threonine-protein kinase